MAPVLRSSPGCAAHGGEGERGTATGEGGGYREGEGGGYREGEGVKRGRNNARLAEEYQIAGPAPFSLYTEEYPWRWRAPRLTLPGKPPHRIASTVRARG